MMREGAQSLYPIERLSVRGYVEVIKHLFGLLRLRKNLLRYYLKNPPDLFIGIDAPDFNFWLEKNLKLRVLKPFIMLGLLFGRGVQIAFTGLNVQFRTYLHFFRLNQKFIKMLAFQSPMLVIHWLICFH